ncbi:MAG: HAMP domain-containing sensor histidine kinase [Planctomycetota bacterium]
MIRRRGTWWTIYGLCAAVALAALTGVSLLVLDLERAERKARAQNARQQDLRLALWRMDAWFAPRLAREAARPWFEYESFYSQDRAYTRILNPIEPGMVLTPSPLLAFRSDLIRLHFQVDEKGEWTSPQVPRGNLRDLAEASGIAHQEIDAFDARLAELRDRVDVRLLGCDAEWAELDLNRALNPGEDPGAEQRKDQRERQKRAQNAYQVAPGLDAIASVLDSADLPHSGALLPVWLDGRDGPELCFVRRVLAGGGELRQGFLTDWTRLERALLAEISDLFGAARLEPRRGDQPPLDDAGRWLAAIPAALHVEPPALAPGPRMTPARWTLAVSWSVALLALFAAGSTLRASISFGEKRSRFASTVTHELRTPLTTFRMYSEMLAQGMVPAARRGDYLETLQRESERLARLVENVLAYAHLEEGRNQLRKEPIDAAALLERSLLPLERRAAEAGLPLVVEQDAVRGLRLSTDAEAVGQILFNLVDNACKYGRSEAAAGIELTARAEKGSLLVRVRDHGRGVPARLRRAIFAPFARGDRDATDPHPGVGLGLALARGLARDLGGDLTLEPGSGSGACFLLRLPLRP